MKIHGVFGGIGKTLGVRNYRYYWIGSFISILGFWIHKLALAWLTWELTKSPFWLGMVGFAALFPSFIFSPFSGALADRFGMRLVAYYSIVASGLLALLLGILVSLEMATIEIVFVLTFLQGTGLAFDLPARQGLVNLLVKKEDLSSAIALNTTTFHIGAFIGPAIFGFLLEFLSIQWVFYANALTFLVFTLCLRELNISELKNLSTPIHKITEDIREGIYYLLGHTGIRSLFILAIIPHLFIRPFVDFLPGFSEEVFYRGADGFAILASSFGLGSLLLGFLLAVRGKTQGLAKIYIYSALSALIFLLLFAATNIFWFAVTCVFAVGVSIIGCTVSSQSLIQNAVDPDKRGRIISLSTGMAVGLPAIGALVLGSLGEKFGLQIPFVTFMLIGIFYWILAARTVVPNSDMLEKSR